MKFSLPLFVILFLISACSAQTSLSPKEFKAKLDAGNVTLLDVRSAAEFKTGHLASALNININGKDFLEQASKLDKSKPVLVYCLAGARSHKAALALKEKGYTVVELNGGIEAWQEANQPIEK